MRTRIALAAALAATFTITSFDTHPAGAQPRAGTAAGGQPVTVGSVHDMLAGSIDSTGSVDGDGSRTAGLTADDLLWPKLANAAPATTRRHTRHPAWASATRGARALPALLAVAERAGTAAPAVSPAAAPVQPAPAPAPAAVPAPPPPAPTDSTSTDTTDWQCIRIHESGDAYNDPARPSGAYGILESTWLAYGYEGWPYEAPAPVQDALALELYHEYGWSPWSTSTACGL